MSEAIKSLELERLSVSERLELIEHLLNSLPEAVEHSDVPEWHLHEIALRYEYAQTHPGEGKPWREVMKELEARV